MQSRMIHSAERKERRSFDRRPLGWLLGVFVVVVFFGEGDHINTGEHVVLDVDCFDGSVVVETYERNPAFVPEIFAVFFARFNIQFQSLSSHFVILIF